MSRWSLILLITLVLVALAAGLLLWWRQHRQQRLRRALPPPARPRLPLVLVHGIFGADRMGPTGQDYFRGIVARLREAGCEVHVPRLPAAASVPERAAALAAFVRAIAAPRVTVIAHSLGGLDARFAIARLGLDERVAALITIATPHRGTPLADLVATRPAVAARKALARLGAGTGAIEWLTTSACARFNDEIADCPRVLYASIVSRAAHHRMTWTNPLLLPTWALLRLIAGPSDGIVPTESQRWGESWLELDVDHWAQIGWSLERDPWPAYAEILRRLADRGL